MADIALNSRFVEAETAAMDLLRWHNTLLDAGYRATPLLASNDPTADDDRKPQTRTNARSLESRMNSGKDADSLPTSFDGAVRLFPLPNLVLFPGVVKGLHIFEPRYCEMLMDSLATDRLIAMALLKPGWEADYLNRPAIHDVVCLGKIVHHEARSDGRHNILLSGLKRARLVREKLAAAPRFRQAQVILLEDVEIRADDPKRAYYVERLLNAVYGNCASTPLFSQLPTGSVKDLSLGSLTDLIAHALPMGVEEKQALLAERDVERRIASLLRILGDPLTVPESLLPADSNSTDLPDDGYPPRFSRN